MMKRFRACLPALLLLLTAPLPAQVQAGWRFWSAPDGLTETYCRTLGVTPGGSVWVRHGAVASMSVLDGYTVTRIQEPRTASSVNWSVLARVYASPPGDAWTVEDGALKQYRNRRWIVHATQAPGEQMRAAIPRRPSRILVLFSDRLAEYDTDSRSWTVVKKSAETAVGSFLGMVRGIAGEFWVTGAHGAGKLETTGNRKQYQWTECDTRTIGLQDLEDPLPGEGGELFVAGLLGRSGARALARWQGSRVELVSTASRRLRGWRGADGSLWILQGTSLARLADRRREAIERRGALAGITYDVAAEPNGVFWMATSEGVARYAPPLWSTPEPVRHIDQPVHAIVEDRKGRLWFAATEYLIELDGPTWRIHPLPKDFRTHTVQSENLTVLPDGRIAMKGYQAETLNRLVVFDPKTRAYQNVTHPEGRTIVLAWRRQDGTFWVRTGSPCQLEIYDGKTFHPRLDAGNDLACSGIRWVHESADGAVWIGTSSQGGGVYRRGKLEMFGPAQGFPEAAVTTIFEHAPGRILAAGRDVLAEFDGKRWSLLRTGLDRAQSIMKSRDGTLWIASGTGIHRLKDGAWLANGEEDGLPTDISHEIFQDSRGRIWAGTSRGLSLYHPEADTDPPKGLIAPASNPHEAPPDGSIKIVFSGIDKWKYTAAERLLYSYRLDRGAWSLFSSSNTASFQRLRHGHHRIEVRAMDRNGNVDPTPDAFDFAVLLPWYKQAGFILIAAGSFLVISTLLGLAAAQYRALKRAKQTAESASRSKSEFLANMSHEIRTPMNAILGMTALAMEIAPNTEQHEYLDTVQKSAGSLLGILDDILDLSKVEAGRLELAPVDFNLRECVEETLRTLRLRAEEKGLALKCQLSPEVPHFVTGDDRRLRQVLLNLVGNAIKFTARGEVSVQVALKSSADQGVTVLFAVTDTGVGVPVGKQKIIFAPFEQADSSTTRTHGGTGLGLAISARLVRLMNGDIWVESPWRDAETGAQVAGSAFYFTTQFGWGKPPAPALEAAKPVAAPPLRVLLVEDNVVNQKLASRLLERLGHSVVVAADGLEALAALERQPVDVVLMDVQMPKMDGFEATAAIRQKERARGAERIPIVALTAHALQGDRETCLAAGMDAYLAKPVLRDDLARVLAEVTEARAVACALTPTS